jgi:flavodoxin
MKSLLVLYSFHHHNTEKVARVFARVLDADIKTPRQVDPDALKAYAGGLIGFGSGIYSDQHHTSLLNLVDRLPHVTGGKAFIFSTSGAPAFALDGGHGEDYIHTAHASLKAKLQSRGYVILDEFICPGWNTNKFLRLFGGINKGRPNAEDLKRAEAFARRLKQRTSDLQMYEDEI